MSRLGVLAEGEELWSNTLFRHFNGLRTTLVTVDVDWRISAGCNGLVRVHGRSRQQAADPAGTLVRKR